MPPNNMQNIERSLDAIARAIIGGGNTGWWQELGRATAANSVNPTSLSVTLNNPKKYLKIVILQHSGGSALTSVLRLNGDSGANYDFRLQENATADNAQNAQTGVSLGSNTLDGMQGEVLIINEAAYVKPIVGTWMYYSAAAGQIYRNIVGAKWNNAVNQITSVQLVATGGSYKNGSELIVLGHD